MMRLLLILCVGALAVAACRPTASEPSNVAVPQEESGKGVDRSRRGQAAPIAAFKDGEGGSITLGEFQGQPTLVNLWASWCAPCVKELPTLQKLESKGGTIQIAAISQDSGPQQSVVEFLDKAKAGSLTPFQDPGMKLSGALGVQILPTTILYDAEGRELWRYVGDLDWTGPEAATLLAEAGAAD